MAVISSDKSNILLSGTSGNDTIENMQQWEGNRGDGGSFVTIDGAGGDDDLYNGVDGTNISISGGSGDDYIRNWGTNATISCGTGNDTISTWGDKVTISGGNGNDSIYNGGENVTISGGDGDDDIWNNDGKNTSISGDSGNDSISNRGSNVTISGGDGDDYILNEWGANTSNTSISGGNGNDSIENWTSKVTISGGAGNDSISSFDEFVTINAGAGNDLISLDSYAKNNLIQYKSGDGNDIIYGFNETSVLSIAGSISLIESSYDHSGVNFYLPRDIILTVGDGKITVVNGESFMTVTGDEAYLSEANFIIDQIEEPNTWKLSGTTAKYGSSDKTLATIKGVKSKKGLSVSGNTISLNSSALSKKVTVSGDYEFNFNSNYTNATITGSKASDKIVTGGSNLLINGKGGNDSLVVNGNNSTVVGGTGNDTIRLGNNRASGFIQYSAGDGKDRIYGFGVDDTLQIGGGTGTYSSTKSGNNIIVTVGKGKISLVGAANLSAVHINNDMLLTDKTKSTVKVDSSIKTIDASARTKAIKITGNAKANTIVGGTKNDSLYGGNGNDSILGNAGNDKLYGQAGNDKLYGGAGKDSLWGGKGNDSLWGNAGADTFIYSTGDGKDVIYGFEDDDLLKITGTFSASYSKAKSEVYFKVGNTSKAITLKNFTASTFHVNGDTYQISGSKFKKQQ